MRGVLFEKSQKGRYAMERRAEILIFAVFQELRDRLTPKEAGDVAVQLPTSLRMLWTSFDRPERKVRRLHEGQFLSEVARMAGLESETGERAGG